MNTKRFSTWMRVLACSGSMSQIAPATEDSSELPSWGVKQKPTISRPSSATARVGVEMTVCDRMRQ